MEFCRKVAEQALRIVNFGTCYAFAPEMEKTMEKLDGVPRSQGIATDGTADRHSRRRAMNYQLILKDSLRTLQKNLHLSYKDKPANAAINLYCDKHRTRADTCELNASHLLVQVGDTYSDRCVPLLKCRILKYEELGHYSMEIRKKKKEKYANPGFHVTRKIITEKSMEFIFYLADFISLNIPVS